MVKGILLAPLLACTVSRKHEGDVLMQVVNKGSIVKQLGAKAVVDEGAVDEKSPLGKIGGLLQESMSVKWTQSEKDDILVLVASLQTSYNDQLKVEHDADQHAWDMMKSKEELCLTLVDTRFSVGGDVHYDHQVVDDWQAKHMACQKVSKSHEQYEKQTSPCVEADAFPNIAAAHRNLKAAMETLDADIVTYHATSPTSATMPASCAVDQTLFETALCALRKSLQWACQAHAECKQLVGLDALKDDLAAAGVIRRELNLQFKILVCKLQHVLGKTNDGTWGPLGDGEEDTKCDSTTLSDEEKENLTLTMEIPAEVHCAEPEVAIYPSADSTKCGEWRQQEYLTWNDQDYTIPTDCLGTCATTPQPPTKPTVPEGCTDSGATPGQCNKFLQGHHDACPHEAYKEAGFDPVAECCACGGGEGGCSGVDASTFTYRGVVGFYNQPFTALTTGNEFGALSLSEACHGEDLFDGVRGICHGEDFPKLPGGRCWGCVGGMEVHFAAPVAVQTFTVYPIYENQDAVDHDQCWRWDTGNYCIGEFKVEYWGGTAWQEAYSFSGDTNGKVQGTIAGAHRARSWRFYIPAGNTPYLSDIEITKACA